MSVCHAKHKLCFLVCSGHTIAKPLLLFSSTFPPPEMAQKVPATYIYTNLLVIQNSLSINNKQKIFQWCNTNGRTNFDFLPSYYTRLLLLKSLQQSKSTGKIWNSLQFDDRRWVVKAFFCSAIMYVAICIDEGGMVSPPLPLFPKNQGFKKKNI